MKTRTALLSILIFIMAGCSTASLKTAPVTDNAQKTSLLYQKFIKQRPPNIAQLNLFFTRMPKGGDLHHHYSGSIYVETFLDWVEKKGLLIDATSLNITKTKNTNSLTVPQLRQNPALYRRLLTLWSDKDYHNHFHIQPAPDTNFFNTFGYFHPVSEPSNGGLQILKQRALRENVSYIETMLKTTGYSYSDPQFDRQIIAVKDKKSIDSMLDQLSSQIEADQHFRPQIKKYLTMLEHVHKGIDCERFTMRFQSYAVRNMVPSKVFSALYSAFTAARESELLVGVNLLSPENGIVSLRDYTLHMLMFSYLNEKFPDVNIALHAGELTLGMVRPRNLSFHIYQALNIGKAKRIGHGVDLPFEQNQLALLKKLKEKAVIEICLTSNQFILGVEGNAHPYLIYAACGVPLVICTDDSGVSRNNLTHEYTLLASRYKPDYFTLKQYVYNSIRYAFLNEEKKNVLIKDLDQRFAEFEAEMAEYSSTIN